LGPVISKSFNEKKVEFSQYFVDIISNMLFAIWQDFVIVWHNTQRTVCHLAMDCLPHWCCWTVLPDGVMQHNFIRKWCHFACLCARASEGIFQGGATSGFRSFSTGGQKWWILFFTTAN